MKILLGFLAGFAAAAQNFAHIAKLARDLEQRYQVSWTTVLFKEGGEECHRALGIAKMLMDFRNRVTVKSVSDYLKMFEIHEAEEIIVTRSFYLVLGDKVDLRKELKQLWDRVKLEDTIWLVCLDGNTVLEEFFGDVKMVYNTDMLVAQPLPDGSEKVSEVYRITMERPVRVVDYGLWTRDRGLTSKVPVSFYLRRQNLEGINFKVISKKNIRSKRGRGDLFSEIWKDLELKLNFTSTFKKVNSSQILLPGGVPGIMNSEKMDAGLAEVTITPERCSLIYCLRPIVATKNQLYFKKTRLDIRWDAILKPFHTETWITIIFWFCLSSLALNVCFRIGRKYKIEGEGSDIDILHSFEIVFNAVCQKGSVVTPDSFSCRVIFFLSYGVSSILFTVYSASLASFVTVQQPFRPFENLQQLLQDGTYTLQPVRHSDVYSSFANATDSFTQEVYRKLIVPERDLPGSIKEALDRICRDEKIVYIGTEFQTEKAVMDINRKGNCEIISPEKPLNVVYITILLSKSSHFKELFNFQLDVQGHGGLINRHMKNARQEMDEEEEKTFVGVGFIQIIQIYVILILGIFVSFAILLLEKLSKRK